MYIFIFKLQKASDTVTEEAKKTMSQMLLFDVELITYTACGRVKDVLCNLVNNKDCFHPIFILFLTLYVLD